MPDVLERQEWKFVPVEVHLDGFDGAEKQALLRKWDLTSQVLRFRFDQSYKRGMAGDFITAFLNDENVRATVRLVNSRGAPAQLGPGSVGNVKWDPLECTQVSMDFFERMLNGEVVRASGHVCKMQDDFKPGGVTVADRLRQLFMYEDESEHAGMYTEDEKRELLYHVMHRCVSGGAMMQYEDDYTVYKDTVKGIYKDLITVQRNPQTGDIEPASHVYQVHSVGGTGNPLFGRPDFPNHNFCYLCINPIRREVTYWYGGFASAF